QGRFGAEPLDQAGRDGYVADLARIGASLGVPDPPRTEAGLTARIDAYRAELAGTGQAREAARFLLLSPPLPAIARAPYGVLAAAAGGADRGDGIPGAGSGGAAGERTQRTSPSWTSAVGTSPAARATCCEATWRGWMCATTVQPASCSRPTRLHAASLA